MVSADLFVFIDQRLLEWSAPPDPVGKPTYCSVKDPENVGKSAVISVKTLMVTLINADFLTFLDNAPLDEADQRTFGGRTRIE